MKFSVFLLRPERFSFSDESEASPPLKLFVFLGKVYAQTGEATVVNKASQIFLEFHFGKQPESLTKVEISQSNDGLRGPVCLSV